MVVVDSRVRQGVLTLAGTDFSCQPSAVSIEPDNEEGNTDELEVLCGDKLSEASGGGLSANLVFTAVQDFTNATGLIGYSWKNNGKTVAFTWQPTNQATDLWTGEVTVQALNVGGEVGSRLTNSATWKITKLTLPPRLGGSQVIPPAAVVVPITGVTAGAPGAFAPGTATLPANLAALKAHAVVGDLGTSKPAANWTSGQYVMLADGSQANWNGTAWVAGAHA